MPVLALRYSDGRNAVSELHGHVARRMWNFLWPEVENEDDVPITYITNGVHTGHLDGAPPARPAATNTWARTGSTTWMTRTSGIKLDDIPAEELWAVRQHLKRKLAFYMRERVRERWTHGGFHPVQVIASGVLLDPYALTIGFARRFATYKRASLILSRPASAC